MADFQPLIFSIIASILPQKVYVYMLSNHSNLPGVWVLFSF